MAPEKLYEKLQNLLQNGQSKEQIYFQLLKEGYKLEEINAAYNYPLVAEKIPQKKNIEIDTSKLTASKILLYLGGLITILGGVIYIGINWNQWNQIGRILAIFVPMLITYLIGYPAWFNKTYQKQALVFIFTGSLLFPLFLYTTFTEFHIYKNSLDAFGFAIALLTLIFYLIESLIISSPIWGFLSPMAGLFVYHFGIGLLGTEHLFKTSSKAWAYLLPATFYIFLGFYYQKNKLYERAKYLFLIGVIAAMFSLIFILINSFRAEKDAWFLLIPCLLYFLTAIYFEKSSQKQHSTSLYFLSILTLFLTVGRLAISGDILNLFFGHQFSNYITIGGSITIAGTIYLSTSYLLPQLKKFGLEEPVRFGNFLKTIGTLAFLGGIFDMGLGGKKPIYETLLLLASLGFIFGSILNQSRAFLYLGTLFLVIYIFGIGTEYFQNQLGWPLTLFVAGLISMGIGFIVEKLRHHYFKGNF